ncbi:MAG: EthD domain-containing protein [Sneathiella sp.]
MTNLKTQTAIKLTFCLHRHPSWSVTDFHRYWLEEHGPLVRQLKTKLKILRYTQVHNKHCDFGFALGKIRQAPDAFDGIAEMWWRSMDDFEAAMTSKAGRESGKILLEDEQKFIDLSRSPIWLNEVHDIVNHMENT